MQSDNSDRWVLVRGGSNSCELDGADFEDEIQSSINDTAPDTSTETQELVQKAHQVNEPPSATEDHLVQERLNSQDQQCHSMVNWQQVIHKKSQLPFGNDLQEAPDDYVYTIQISGKWLVSGSKDKRIRIWNLETGKQKRTPLRGHTASVVTLQFDPSQDEDIIISGSSDASIIVWRFSTGRILKQIDSAHEGSILKLCFNQKYLFTASRDHNIKIWNRHDLSPLDKDYPRIRSGPNTIVPTHIVDIYSVGPGHIRAGLADGSIEFLRPYTHLATLTGHPAAVNALDVHGDVIVSGSGDGAIKVWDITTGQCVRTIIGHSQGVACLQTDGKHIISGGSDKTIRIFDLHTGVGVAVLQGHTNIVRTIQVDFANVLESVADRVYQALQASDDVQGTGKAAAQLENFRLRREFQGIDGVSSISKIRTVSIPKEEGGCNWNRIVSGSYDESVIIWKKDESGKWFVEHTLPLEEKTKDTSIPPKIVETGGHTQHSRVFKIAFDARRIACASQNSRIYSWEFC